MSARRPTKLGQRKLAEFAGGACPVVKREFRSGPHSVNMSAAAIRKWAKDSRAGCGSFKETVDRLTKTQFWKQMGITTPSLASLKAKPQTKWTATDCVYAQRVNNFNRRMQGNVDAHGCGVRNVTSLLNGGRKPPGCAMPPDNCVRRPPRVQPKKR